MAATARLFFALDVPKSAADALLEAQATLRPFAERFEPRWCRREQMHLTLKFLGDVATERIDELSRLLPTDAQAFDAELGSVTVFPDARRARVLVVEVKPADERLGELASALDREAARFGVEKERRPFRPHLTLARFKSSGNAAFLLESARLEPLKIRFDLLRLYESSRAEYVPRCTVKLADSCAAPK